MKQTAFTKRHIEAGAKMVPFAGYNMPIEFFGINKEHNHVREKVGVFDVSHMGEIWVKGPSALKFLQYTTTNDVATLTPGKIHYTCFPNGKGGIVDDFLLYCVDQESYLLVVNASNTQKAYDHLAAIAPKFDITPGKELYDATPEIAQLAVQGPLAMEVVQKIVEEDVLSMEFSTFKKVTVAGIKDAILSITGYTGSGGCEIYVANEDADQLWEALYKAGEEYDIKSIGLGARDTLRLEMGYCLYGNELGEDTSTIEAGLGWITKFSEAKGDFLDRELLLSQKEGDVERKLVAFELLERGIPRQGYTIQNSDGEEIGVVTSGTMGPAVKKAIGLAYVKPQYTKVGTQLEIVIRNKGVKAEVVRAPFYKG